LLVNKNRGELSSKGAAHEVRAPFGMLAGMQVPDQKDHGQQHEERHERNQRTRVP